MNKFIMPLFLVLFLFLAVSSSTGAAAQQPVDLLVENGLVVTMDAKGTVLERGSVAINNGAILAVGPAAELQGRYTAGLTIDAAGKLVMPGLVNTHTHAAMTLFRGLADDLPLDTWLTKHIWPAEANFITAETVRVGTNLALAEMIRSGTTTFNDMYFFLDVVAAAAKKAGVRAVVGEPVIDFPTPDSRTPQESLARIEKLAGTWKNDPLITISVAPHAPYTCSPGTLKAAKQLADTLGLPLQIHLSETRKEVRDVEARYGATPIEYLDNLGFFGGTVIAAHVVYPTAKEITVLAARKVGVAHNPESNMKLASGVAPVAEMRKAGVTVGLGTDGAASNNNLNMFEEMNTAAKLQKVVLLDPTVMSARDTVAMATSDGATVLGLGDRTGSLEPGKRGDLIVIDLHRPHLTPLYNVYSQLVYAVNGADVESVVVDGRVIMADRKLLTLDEEQILREATALAVKIKAVQPPDASLPQP